MREEEQERWAQTMPILAAIKTYYDEECGAFIRTTEWGDLYVKGEHYTLVKKSKPGRVAKEDAYWVRSQVGEWLKIKFKYENRGILVTPELKEQIANTADYTTILWRDLESGSITQLIADAHHSALLIHLLEGKAPKDTPPVLQNSYPVYEDD